MLIVERIIFHILFSFIYYCLPVWHLLISYIFANDLAIC